MPSFRRRWGVWMLDLAGQPRHICTKEEIAARDPEEVAATREYALAFLRTKTGQDFGYDVDRWDAWLESHPHSLDATEEEIGELKRRHLYI